MPTLMVDNMPASITLARQVSCSRVDSRLIVVAVVIAADSPVMPHTCIAKASSRVPTTYGRGVVHDDIVDPGHKDPGAVADSSHWDEEDLIGAIHLIPVLVCVRAAGAIVSPKRVN